MCIKVLTSPSGIFKFGINLAVFETISLFISCALATFAYCPFDTISFKVFMDENWCQ